MERSTDPRVAVPRKRALSRLNEHAQVIRAEPRLRTHLRTGWIADLRHQLRIECLFMDISPHGARLRLDKATQGSLPAQLVLFDDRSQKTYRVELRWHRGNEAGVYIREGTAGLATQ